VEGISKLDIKPLALDAQMTIYMFEVIKTVKGIDCTLLTSTELEDCTTLCFKLLDGKQENNDLVIKMNPITLGYYDLIEFLGVDAIISSKPVVRPLN